MSSTWASQIEKLNDSNFKGWRFNMKTILLHNNLWQYVSGECKKPEADPSNKEEILNWQYNDEKAMATILIAVRKRQLEHIQNCKTAREAWIKLDEVHLNSAPPKKKKDGVGKHKEMPFNEVLLGSLVYEWLQRILYYTDFRLSDSIITSMANHFKLALCMDWFSPNMCWISAFRQKYNLPDCNTKTLSIGYSEPLSANIRDICRDLIPLWNTNKMPETPPAQVKAVPHKTIRVEIVRPAAAVTATKVKKRSSVAIAKTATIVNKVVSPTSTNVIEPMQTQAIPKKSSTSKMKSIGRPIYEVIEISENDFQIDGIQEKLAENGVQIVRGTVDFEDRLPTTLCTVNGSTTILPLCKLEEVDHTILKGEPIDIESCIPTALCYVAGKTSDNEDSNTSKSELPQSITNMKRKDTEPSANTAKKNKIDENTQQSSLLAQKFVSKRRLETPCEALICIKLLEDFAMIKENFRLIGLIERLEKLMQ